MQPSTGSAPSHGTVPEAPPVLVLLGPTASGKTGLAVAAAERLADRGQPTEIVNADSMLLYRGMDIGTAKPTPAERHGIPHHVIDVLDVTETATVAEFQRLARAAIADCRGRGVVPIVVGGSALYLRAVVDTLEFAGTDPAVRARFEQRLAEHGAEALHAELARVDPAAAEAIEPGNGRRIVRALEVIELTGRPYPARLPAPRYALSGVAQVGLGAPRDWVDERIERRVQQMWRDGLVAEVRGLLPRGLATGRTASRAIGYQQVLAHLAGELTDEEARTATAAATRRFVRRQLAWWRRDRRIAWIDARHPTPRLVSALLAALDAGPDPGPADSA